MKDVIITLIVFAYLAFIVAGTAYLVFWKDASGWWFLVAAVFCNISYKSNDQ